MKLVKGVCPKCGSEELGLDLVLKAKPIGEFSLAGGQVKFSTEYIPTLDCYNWTENGLCTFSIDGKVENGQAVFKI